MGFNLCSENFFPHEKPTLKDMLIICTAEIFGTAILTFFGCGSCVEKIAPSGVIPVETISFGFGFAVLMAVQCFGHISGAHINPVVTLTAAILGHLPCIYLPAYFVGQFLGAMLGFGVLVALTPFKYRDPGDGPGLCTPAMNPGISQIQACFFEFTITLILVLVCCGVWDKRNAINIDSIPVRFGLTIAGLAMVGIPYTGANMNPARSIAPAIINGDFRDDLWLYFVGPLLSAVFGGFFYRFVFAPVLDRQQKAEAGE